MINGCKGAYSPFGGLCRQSVPLSATFQMGLEHRHQPSEIFQMRRRHFWNGKFIGKLKCHKDDDYEDLGDDEATFVYALKFCPIPGMENFLAVANEEGSLQIQDTDKSGSDSMALDIRAHNNAIFDVAWRPHNIGQLVTASGDQTVGLFETTNEEECGLIRKFRAYTRSVKCVEFAPDNPNLLATGSRENSILVWDLREPSDSRPALAIRRAHTHSSTSVSSRSGRKSNAGGSLSSSVTAIQFQSDVKLVSSSDTDGILKVWDLRRSYDRYKGEPQAQYLIPYPGKSALHGYTSLVFDSSRTYLYASCKDNHIYMYDMASYSEKVVRSYDGYKNGSKFFIRMSLSGDDRYLACGSSDSFAYIWDVDDPQNSGQPIYKLTGNESEVTCVDWSKNSTWVLATSSDEMKHRIWRLWPDDSIDNNDFRGDAEPVSHVIRPPARSRPARDRNDENEAPNVVKKRRTTLSSFPSSICLSQSKKKPASPRRVPILLSPLKQILAVASPTANLPNFVLDGKSPRQTSTSGSATKPRRIDWLTSLSRQKKLNESPVSSSGSPKSVSSPVARRGRGVKRSLNMDASKRYPR